MTYFSSYTYQDANGRWYWQREGRFKTFDAPGFDSRAEAQADASRIAELEFAQQRDARARRHQQAS